MKHFFHIQFPIVYVIMLDIEKERSTMKMMVDIAHDFLEEKMNGQSIAIDFTMGNGYDTLFLAQRVKKVYAFDVQKAALEVTAKRLKEAQINNVELILDGHENAQNYIPYYDVGIFNLGYLPNLSHEITTQAQTTIKALKTALDLLKVDGRLVLVVYPGHVKGKEEAEVLEVFVKALSPHDYHVASMRMENKKLSPYILLIDKRY